VWLICRAAIGKGKNKLLVRGIEGAQWVFCPLIKSTKRDRISTDRCQTCKHFVRFKEISVPQTPTAKKTPFFRTSVSKSTFHIKKTSRSKTAHPPATLFPYIPSLTKERQLLVDIFEEQDHLIILAELPGVNEKDFNIKTDQDTLTISTNNKTPKYLKKVQLPTAIKRGIIKSTYKNNILQVKLKKLNTNNTCPNHRSKRDKNLHRQSKSSPPTNKPNAN
jgi:HSP20 family molecular chaperone IbpA